MLFYICERFKVLNVDSEGGKLASTSQCDVHSEPPRVTSCYQAAKGDVTLSTRNLYHILGVREGNCNDVYYAHKEIRLSRGALGLETLTTKATATKTTTARTTRSRTTTTKGW